MTYRPDDANESDDRPAPNEIEITPEMISAGYAAVRRHDVEAYDEQPWAEMRAMLADIYLSMSRASC